MSEVSIAVDGGVMPGYLAVPDGSGPWPGVVLVHDVVGMGSDLRTQADWLAEEGYLALAPNLFHWSGHTRCLLSSMRDYLRRRGRVFDDLEAARGWIMADERCSGRVGVIGWCFGGGFALLLALTEGYDASSVNYGYVPADYEEVLARACPVIGSFAGRDGAMAASARRLQTVAARPDNPHQAAVYAGAQHGYLNDHSHDDLPRLLLVQAAVAGSTSTYSPRAAALTRRRIVAFFDRHLRDAAGASP